jgi:hypothetical protein
MLLHLVVDASDNRGEEQILDVRDENANGRALTGAKGARGSVGLVVQGLRCRSHASVQVGADPA